MILMQGKGSKVEISNTDFKKSQSSAIHVEYEEDFQLLINHSKFNQNKG